MPNQKQRIEVKEAIVKFHQWRGVFLATLKGTGSVMLSCQAAHVSRTAAYKLRTQNQTFRKQWQEAENDAIETLEAIARKRASESSDVLLIFLLKAHRPDKYRDVVKVEHTVVREEIKRLAAESGVTEEAILAEYELLTRGQIEKK